MADTTPGDRDRGRGRLLADVRDALAAARDGGAITPTEWQAFAYVPVGQSEAAALVACAALLGLAAPAETEAARLTADHDPEACPLCGPRPALRERVGQDVIGPHDAAAAPPPQGPAETEAGDDLVMARCGRADCLGHWVREDSPAPAGPQAEGAGETAGGER